MKKIIKILLITFIVIVVLGIAAVVLGFIFMDKIVKQSIVTVAPMITQTPVTLNTVHLSLMSGSCSLEGFVIGNPEGYKTPYAVSVGKAALSIDPKTISADKIVIRSIEMVAPEVTFEGNPFGENNLKKIQDNVNSLSAGKAAAPADTNAPAPAKSQGASKKLEVDNFSITGIKIHATLTGVSSLPGMEGKELTLPIPDIQFTQLGTGPDGITAAELSKKVLQQITSEAITAVANNAKSLASGAAGKLLNNASPAATDAVKKGLGGLLGK